MVYADVMRVFETSMDPDNVDARAPYMSRIRFDGVWSSGSMFGLGNRCRAEGHGEVEGSLRGGPANGAKWVGERSNDVSGCAIIAAMIARTGLGQWEGALHRGG